MKNWRYWLAAILIGWTAIFVVGRMFPPTQSKPVQVAEAPVRTPEIPSHLGLGDSGTIISGAPVAMLSTTKDGYDEINNALAAKDEVGLRNLILTGKAFTVKAGTNGKVIDTSFTLRRVRILDGEKINAAGWLPFEYLK